MTERTIEARVLDRYPEIRQAAIESHAFAEWSSGLTAMEIDGETLYLRGGDMLRDHDQIVFEWARRTGLLTDASVAAALVGDNH